MTRSHTDDRRTHQVPDRYRDIHQGFGWKVPKRFNMAQACCGQWAAQAATAKRQAIREHVAGQGLGGPARALPGARGRGRTRVFLPTATHLSATGAGRKIL